MLGVTDFPSEYYYGGNFSTQCESLGGPPAHKHLAFCEDIALWDVHTSQNSELQYIIASCDPGRREWNTVMGPLKNPDPYGSLWIYDTFSGSQNRLTLEGYPAGHDFHPLGLDIYPSHDQEASTMFVVNHARERTFIEQFVVNPSAPSVATYVRTLDSMAFNTANSIAMTSPSSFYVSNDHYLSRRIPYIGDIVAVMETVLGLPFSNVFHVEITRDSEGKVLVTFDTAASGLAFPNGIALSSDGAQLAIASSSLSRVDIYNRDGSGHLSHHDRVLVPFCPDNVHYDHTGALLVTGHPHFPTLIKTAANVGTVSPSWIVEIRPGETEEEAWDTRAPISASSKVPATSGYIIDTLLQSNGSGISSATTAIRTKAGELYVAGLYDDRGMLACTPMW